MSAAGRVIVDVPPEEPSLKGMDRRVVSPASSMADTLRSRAGSVSSTTSNNTTPTSSAVATPGLLEIRTERGLSEKIADGILPLSPTSPREESATPVDYGPTSNWPSAHRWSQLELPSSAPGSPSNSGNLPSGNSPETPAPTGDGALPEQEKTEPDELEPPSHRVKTIVWRLMWGARAEETNGYIIISFLAVAIGSFGSYMRADLFWLCNLVALLEVALKLMRNWADIFGDVKCCEVSSQWDMFSGLKLSLRIRFVAVISQAALYSITFYSLWNSYRTDRSVFDSSDYSTRWQPSLYQLVLVTCAFLVVHWIMGIWVLAWGLSLWTASGLTPLLLVPGFGSGTWVETGTVFVLGCLAFLSGLTCQAFVTGRYDGLYKLFVLISDRGSNPRDVSLSSLTWYVHYRRHPLLRGLAAERADNCGLKVNWTLSFSEMVELLRSVHYESARVSESEMEWVVGEIIRSLRTRRVCGKDVDGLVLLDVMLQMAEDKTREDDRAPLLEVVDLLFEKDLINTSLKAAKGMFKGNLRSEDSNSKGGGMLPGWGLQRLISSRAAERLADRLCVLGDGLGDRDRWGESERLHSSALDFRTHFDGGEEGKARSLTGVAWAIVHRSPISVEDLERAEKLSREAISVANKGTVNKGEMAVHLSTLAYVLRCLGRAEDVEEEKMMREMGEKLAAAGSSEDGGSSQSLQSGWPKSPRRRELSLPSRRKR